MTDVVTYVLQEESLLFLASYAMNVARVDDHKVRSHVNRNLVLFEPDNDVGQGGAVELVVAELNVLQRLQRVENSVRKNVLPDAVDPISVQEQIAEIAERDNRFEREVFQLVIREVEGHE